MKVSGSLIKWFGALGIFCFIVSGAQTVCFATEFKELRIIYGGGLRGAIEPCG